MTRVLEPRLLFQDTKKRSLFLPRQTGSLSTYGLASKFCLGCVTLKADALVFLCVLCFFASCARAGRVCSLVTSFQVGLGAAWLVLCSCFVFFVFVCLGGHVGLVHKGS
jgi:hypothetical protein